MASIVFWPCMAEFHVKNGCHAQDPLSGMPEENPVQAMLVS
jgi:hypothetical protein